MVGRFNQLGAVKFDKKIVTYMYVNSRGKKGCKEDFYFEELEAQLSCTRSTRRRTSNVRCHAGSAVLLVMPATGTTRLV